MTLCIEAGRQAAPVSAPSQPLAGTVTPALLPLLWLASPALPIGGFSYSEGLEAAVEAGLVHDEASTAQWLTDQLHLGQSRSDLAVLAQAVHAWRLRDWPTLLRLDQWVRNTRETAELRLQSEQMGRSLIEWLKSLQRPEFLLALLPTALQAPSYPVAYALALAVHLPPEQPPASGLYAYAFGWAENMVQAAIKAVPLGQSAGQRILARLSRQIPAAVTHAMSLPEEDRQAFSPMLAILSARHETQYSRLFRS
ncbi:MULTISPECIES: urease accessory protein UreF [Giesbergeria]|uniref:Urease accessory protein UreF n=1 Tax=Giesbergeria sinuosa TaxID=80883 RepID=A0ABV9QC02_9BURK